MSTIIIIGSGITGVTTAYALARRGYSVTVFDRQRYPAMDTSFANGGQLSASNAEVWNNVATIVKGLRWMLRKDAPLLLNPSPSFHKYSWLAEFVSQIRNYRHNTIETTKLAIAARRHLFELADRESIDFDLEQRGILHVYSSKPDFDAASRVNQLLLKGGLDRRPVTPSEMLTIEPALRDQYYGGFFTPSDATGDIHKFTRGLAAACERGGVRFVFDAEICGMRSDRDGVVVHWKRGSLKEEINAERAVVCAGVGSRRIASMLGDNINIYPVKGYSITVELRDETSQKAAPRVSLLDEATKIVTSRLGEDRFRVAGTAEFNGENRDIRWDRIKPLVRWVERSFPDVCTAQVVPWAGLRPMTPSMMPRVGRGKRANVFYNTGHGHLGWTLSAVTAEMIADVITTDGSNTRLSASVP
ncbi:D-amino acid dehydrogenase [Bradyrhizobium sp. 38]|uniref:D-amino acid dehydrogenase n=1 Tax=unclassified Bradyrhizobium TaxID=2631580 RepID=UPI001FFA09D9|nr:MULTISPECIES: D-amino acid dehydrogenase [unclassified Bradyrhizobium]MCK1337846.1 D-amino acid dehydrogenase [Bradyrhizobium sp. 38]MCK1782289.1 D-amino acid dehydrogenase [Bradyrhizobium sp. 132]